MTLTRSNYSVRYIPEEGQGGHAVEVSVSGEFIEFARQQKINPSALEDIAEQAMRACGIDENTIRMYKRHGFCKWDGGLLTSITIHGNATGLELDLRHVPPAYVPHNVDSPIQAAVLLSIITFYLSSIEGSIESR